MFAALLPAILASIAFNTGAVIGLNLLLMGFILIINAVFFVAWIALCVWVYRDAEKRGMNGVLWLLVVIVGQLLGLILYFILRDDHPKRRRLTSY